MVGRIMTLNDTAFVMTCCCASIVEYSGTGLEFHPVCGAHCAKTGEGRPKVSAAFPQATHLMPHLG